MLPRRRHFVTAKRTLTQNAVISPKIAAFPSFGYIPLLDYMQALYSDAAEGHIEKDKTMERHIELTDYEITLMISGINELIHVNQKDLKVCEKAAESFGKGSPIIENDIEFAKREITKLETIRRKLFELKK